MNWIQDFVLKIAARLAACCTMHSLREKREWERVRRLRKNVSLMCCTHMFTCVVIKYSIIGFSWNLPCLLLLCLASVTCSVVTFVKIYECLDTLPTWSQRQHSFGFLVHGQFHSDNFEFVLAWRKLNSRRSHLSLLKVSQVICFSRWFHSLLLALNFYFLRFFVELYYFFFLISFFFVGKNSKSRERFQGALGKNKATNHW